jgi:nucleotide-binding universal stress UspA family protein
MYRTLLIPLDGSTEAELPLPAVTALVRKHSDRAGLVLLRSAGNSESHETTGPAQVRELEAAESYLNAVASSIDQSGVKMSSIARYGDVVDVIVSQAQSEEAALIVMATHGRRGMDRVLHGSLTEAVLARAKQPVVVYGPAATAGTRFERMLVPLDGGPFSAAMLPEAARFAKSFGIQHIDLITVLPPQIVHVDDLDGTPPAWGLEQMGITPIGGGNYALRASQPPVHERIEELEHALNYWSERLGDSGAEVETRVEYNLGPSSIAQCTLKLAAELRSDIVVMRTHARRGLSRAVTGSVADAVIRSSALPVLLYTTQTLEAAASVRPSADVRSHIGG